MRKGQGISMSMLVVMAIAILVLVIVAMFFSGGFKRLGLSMVSTSEEMSASNVSEAQMLCNQRCTLIKLENTSANCECWRCGDGSCDRNDLQLRETNFTCSIDCH